MLMFTLDISCLTTSNLPWFMDLAFQVLMQYCCLQHQTWLQSPITCTTQHRFHFGSISSFFQELFLHCPPIAYWTLTNLGFPGGSDSKSICLQWGRPGFDPLVQKIPREGNGDPLQYSGLENPMDGETHGRLQSMRSQRVIHDWATSLSLFYWPGIVHLSVSYLCAFSLCSWGLKARILKWFAMPFSSGPHFLRTLHHHPFILSRPT